jgi:hypothetical protein
MLKDKWGLWLSELESFAHMPNFFNLMLKNSSDNIFLFDVLSGTPNLEKDKEEKWS